MVPTTQTADRVNDAWIKMMAVTKPGTDFGFDQADTDFYNRHMLAMAISMERQQPAKAARALLSVLPLFQGHPEQSAAIEALHRELTR